MFVSTMTDAEKRKQAIEDAFEVNKYLIIDVYKKVKKEIRRFSNFPRVFKLSYITKNRNKYYILIKAESRNVISKPFWFHAYTIMDSNEGKYAMIAVLQNGIVETFQIYAPHLFARYTQRYGVQLYEEERIHRFFEDNITLEYGGARIKDGKVFARVKGGALFGDAVGDILIFKTFVDDTLLRQEQVEYGEEIIDMFQERVEFYKQIFR